MKLILDCDPQDMGAAMQIFFTVQPQNPNQKEGTGNAVREVRGRKTFNIIKNVGSYTVKVTQG